MSAVVLTGLDGANPLAFLAALGVVEALASPTAAPVALSWRDEGSWRPVVTGMDGGMDALVEHVHADLTSCAADPALNLQYEGKRDIKPPPALFRSYLASLVADATPIARRAVDWAGAFASDVVVDNNGNTKPTALHFTAGQQQFLKMAIELATQVTRHDVENALVGPWRYDRPLPVMGWDSTMARDYALRASNPSNDKKLGVPGADWLALRGLVCLPVAPVGRRVRTAGCIGGWKNGRFRWGLWRVPLEREVIRSTMRLDLEGLAAPEREARGIGAVFSCGIRRSDQGGYGSFEPAAIV